MSSSTTRIRCMGRASLGNRGGGNRASAPFLLCGGRRCGRCAATAAVLPLMPFASAVLEPPPALVVPWTAGSVAFAAPPGGSEHPSDQEEQPDHQEREEDEPREPVVVVSDHVDHLDLLPIGLRGLDLLRCLLLAVVLAGVVRRTPI